MQRVPTFDNFDPSIKLSSAPSGRIDSLDSEPYYFDSITIEKANDVLKSFKKVNTDQRGRHQHCNNIYVINIRTERFWCAREPLETRNLSRTLWPCTVTTRFIIYVLIEIRMEISVVVR